MLACAFPPENLSGAARPHRFAKHLPHFGYDVEIIAGAHSEDLAGWRNVHRVPRQEQHPLRLRLESRLAGFIRRLAPYEERIPWIPHVVSEAGRILQMRRIGAVLSTSPPIAAHLAALHLKRRYGLKWIADFRDPLLGNPFRTKIAGRSYDTALEWILFRHADAVIANTDTLIEAWRRRYPCWTGKFHVIWNGYDPGDGIRPAPIPPRDHQVLAHAGSIYGGRTPTILLAGLERLIARGRLDPKRIRVLLMGPMELRPEIVAAPPYSTLREAGVLHWTGRAVPVAEARSAISEADFLCLLDVNSRGVGIQVPAKLFDYIRVGRPILAVTAENSPTHRILARSGIRYRCLFSNTSEPLIDAQLLKFFDLSTDPVSPSPWFCESFDAWHQTRELAQLVSSVLAGKGAQTNGTVPDPGGNSKAIIGI